MSSTRKKQKIDKLDKQKSKTQWGKTIQHSESNSLWNYTLSPGWKQEEVQILKLALMHFGIGNWKMIIRSKCLPGKSIGQIYMQTQRLIGQQSLGDFKNLHVDLARVWIDNMKKENVVRKNNCIINMGDNTTIQERKIRILYNQKIYGLTGDQIEQIKLPKFSSELSKNCTDIDLIDKQFSKYTTIEVLEKYSQFRQLIEKKIARMDAEGFEYDANKKIIVNLKKKTKQFPHTKSNNNQANINNNRNNSNSYISNNQLKNFDQNDYYVYGLKNSILQFVEQKEQMNGQNKEINKISNGKRHPAMNGYQNDISPNSKQNHLISQNNNNQYDSKQLQINGIKDEKNKNSDNLNKTCDNLKRKASQLEQTSNEKNNNYINGQEAPNDQQRTRFSFQKVEYFDGDNKLDYEFPMICTLQQCGPKKFKIF